MKSGAIHLIISGEVQGVGYRYFCYQKARQYEVVGVVRNRPDGSVEVVAEGDRGMLEIFIQDLKAGPFSATVRNVKITWSEFTGQYRSFDVTG